MKQDPARSDKDDQEVRHNVSANRYEVQLPGQLAVADYLVENGRMILTHTFVPPEFRGRGLAEKLVRRALEDAREQKLKVVPACSYVDIFIQRHSEYRSLLADGSDT